MGVENDKRRAARRLIVEAAGEHIDQFEGWEGALCTGYVVIYELTGADGRCCLWLTGNGADPDEEHDEGLDSWRVEGMVRKVLRDLDTRNVTQDGD